MAKKGNVLEMYPDLVYGRVMQWEPGVVKKNELVEEINAAGYDLVFANSFEKACVDFFFRLTACVFHAKPASDSMPNQPAIPWETSH